MVEAAEVKAELVASKLNDKEVERPSKVEEDGEIVMKDDGNPEV